jgi:hypothetical protein
MISKVFEENVFPDNENCPDCGGGIWRLGPRGGISQNIECVGCGSRFNIARLQPHHAKPLHVGPLPIVWAQRIPSEAEGGGVWREDMFPRVLQ